MATETQLIQNYINAIRELTDWIEPYTVSGKKPEFNREERTQECLDLHMNALMAMSLNSRPWDIITDEEKREMLKSFEPENMWHTFDLTTLRVKYSIAQKAIISVSEKKNAKQARERNERVRIASAKKHMSGDQTNFD